MSPPSLENLSMQPLLAQETLAQGLGIAAALLAVGGFTFFCAMRDYNWFMMNHRAALLRLILGRGGARYFYMLLGLLFMLGGVGAAWFALFGS